MINFNGTMVSQDTNILTQNRAFFIWRCRFETVKIVNSKILLEDHYFRLMASMRVVRMEIPMNFTMEYLEEQIVSLATLNSLSGSSRAGLLCSGMMEDIASS
jgi:branched-chain amino acid aminotransferase